MQTSVRGEASLWMTSMQLVQQCLCIIPYGGFLSTIQILSGALCCAGPDTFSHSAQKRAILAERGAQHHQLKIAPRSGQTRAVHSVDSNGRARCFFLSRTAHHTTTFHAADLTDHIPSLSTSLSSPIHLPNYNFITPSFSLKDQPPNQNSRLQHRTRRPLQTAYHETCTS